MQGFNWRAVVGLAVLGLVAWVEPAASVPAFPGAEGFGAPVTTGGRGGRIIEVTNLNDSGSGSLRDAVTQSGKRIVVFRVGGEIVLQSSLEIDTGDITIAGQTAPGGGIVLRSDPDFNKETLKINDYAENIIIRYLRFRPGPHNEVSNTQRGLSLARGKRVVIDHCTFSWATDEIVNMWNDSTDISFQWNIVSEALNDPSVYGYARHGDGGPHSRGTLIGPAHKISFHHNLWANHETRGPKVHNGEIDLVNNVSYGITCCHSMFLKLDDQYTTFAAMNVVGNFMKKGTDANWDDGEELEIESDSSTIDEVNVYLSGNIGPGRPNNNLPETDVVRWKNANSSILVNQPFAYPPITTTDAFTAYDQVLGIEQTPTGLFGAGDNAGLNCRGEWFPRQDAVDARVVQDVINRTGELVDAPEQVGGYPSIAGGTACPDADHDGMPDEWETLQGLDPSNAADGPSDPDGDGYTNVETYLNGGEIGTTAQPPMAPTLF